MADETSNAAPHQTSGSTSGGSGSGGSHSGSGGSHSGSGSSSFTPRGPRPAGGPGGGGPGGPGGPRTGGPGGGGGRKFFRRKKVCKFCTEKIDQISYRDVRLLQGFVAERGKIVPRRLSGVCTTHQRRLSLAIKQSRNIALLAFAARF